MFSTLRTRFGIPGVISVIALVFAMLGGAYAASNGSGPLASSSAKHHKRHNNKSKAGKRGPRGPKGATGATGPMGPAGLPGAPGAKGDNGSNGSNGSDGSNGTSATTAAYSGEECENGGIEVNSASPTAYVCNGENGQTGFTETLPSGKSEKGTWSLAMSGTGVAWVPVSFSIPLASSVPTHYLTFEDNPTAECPGSWEEPAAAAGNLCIYQTTELNGTFFHTFNMENEAFDQAGKSGTVLWFTGATGQAGGTWAVTAP